MRCLFDSKGRGNATDNVTGKHTGVVHTVDPKVTSNFSRKKSTANCAGNDDDVTVLCSNAPERSADATPPLETDVVSDDDSRRDDGTMGGDDDDFMEFYSPPRVVPKCHALGGRARYSFGHYDQWAQLR